MYFPDRCPPTLFPADPYPFLTLAAGVLPANWAGGGSGGLKSQERGGGQELIKEVRAGLRLPQSSLEQRCFEQCFCHGRKGTPGFLEGSLAWAKVHRTGGGSLSPARQGWSGVNGMGWGWGPGLHPAPGKAPEPPFTKSVPPPAAVHLVPRPGGLSVQHTPSLAVSQGDV